MPERTDFLEGDAPAVAQVEAFLARALESTGSDAPATAGALVPWICDALLSNHSVKAYGRDLMDFVRHMQAQGVDPLHVTADHVKMYKRAPLEAGLKSATVARRLSVLRGTYKQLAAKGLVSWETAQNIAAVKAAGVQKNSTPSLTRRQAVALLEVILTDTLQGIRDLAMMSVFLPDRLPGLGGDRGVRQRFATKWAIRAPMSVSTGLCENRLRLSGRAREGAETDPAHSTSRHAEFAIRRQPRTRFAFRENPVRERKAAEHRGNAGLWLIPGTTAPRNLNRRVRIST